MSRPLDRFFQPRPAKKKRRRKATRLPVAPSVGRLRVLLIMIAVVFSLVAGRAVQVQAIDASKVATEAADQMTVSMVLPAFRGQITDRNGEVLAFTEDTVDVIGDPEQIQTNGKMKQATDADRSTGAANVARVAALAAQTLGGDVATYTNQLSKPDDGYEVLARSVPSATYRQLVQAMNEAGLLGVRSISDPTRKYPNGSLAAALLGFVNSQGIGSAGLEQALNSSLAGTAGKESYESSPNGKIPMGNTVLVPAQNGVSYQLTIDAALQWQVEQILGDRVRVTGAKSGMAMVMNAKTGEILALATYPSFDANDPGDASAGDLLNHAVGFPYTPGSVQKTLTFAALIDQGLVRPTDVVDVPAKIKSGDDWVTDAWSHGDIKLYARGVLAKSSNVGTIKLSRKSSKQALHDYYASFGLGAKTGVGLPGESAGVLPSADAPDYTRDGEAFGGSGISVTLLQEAAAVAAVTNGGVYHAPVLIKSSTTADGTTTDYPVKTAPRRVVSESTSKSVLSMMETMTQQSTSHTFDIPGYRTGAKTGTSQKYEPTCKCFNGLVTSTIGVGPVEDPSLLSYVVIDSPKRGASGSSVAGPAYQNIMSLAMARYGIPQSTAKAPSLPVAP